MAIQETVPTVFLQLMKLLPLGICPKTCAWGQCSDSHFIQHTNYFSQLECGDETVVQYCNLGNRGKRLGSLRVQRKFETCLDYMRPFLKKWKARIIFQNHRADRIYRLRAKAQCLGWQARTVVLCPQPHLSNSISCHFSNISSTSHSDSVLLTCQIWSYFVFTHAVPMMGIVLLVSRSTFRKLSVNQEQLTMNRVNNEHMNRCRILSPFNHPPSSRDRFEGGSRRPRFLSLTSDMQKCQAVKMVILKPVYLRAFWKHY